LKISDDDWNFCACDDQNQKHQKQESEEIIKRMFPNRDHNEHQFDENCSER